MTAKRRAAEAAVASQQLTPDSVSKRQRRLQLEASIRTGQARLDEGTLPAYMLGKISERVAQWRTELETL